MSGKRIPSSRHNLAPLRIGESLTPTDTLEKVRDQVRKALDNRVKRCKTAAMALALDMESVSDRLTRHGRDANLSTVKISAFYIAQTELELLRRVMAMVDTCGTLDIDEPGYDSDDD